MTGSIALRSRIANGLTVARLGWLGWASVITAALVVAPIAAVVSNVFLPSEATWSHLASTVLPEYIWNTLLLVSLVAVGVIIFGVTTAWLVTAYHFPGQRLLEWALVLPLAMPAYVMAYAYTDWLQAAGPVQTMLRDLTGWRVREYWFPEIRSLPGAAAMLTFALYPYVYLLARNAFLEQSRTTMEAARLAGYGPWGRFWRVALPLARTGIAAGTALALMESLADFGTVSYFAVNTFTAGIYRAWLSLGDPVAAGQLATCLLVFVLVMLSLERLHRGGARYAAKRTPMPPQKLHGAGAVAATVMCATPITFGFLVPAAILIKLAVADPEARFGARIYGLVFNTFTLAGVAAIAAVAVALLLAYAARTVKNSLVHGANRLAVLGYALPGAVIAVGILLPLGRFDNAIAAWMEQQFGIKTGLILTGSMTALIYAYLVRFLAVAFQTVEAGLTRVTPSMDDAARSLGLSPGRTLARVHVPIMSGSLATAALLVFVDVMKELPATFAMRPFNFDTLAVEAYNLAKDERIAEAAVPSLVMVCIALLPLILLSRQIARARLHR
ncbi:MAG TPA: iron ABC transporter permease [Candidatus Binatia bacterium]|jgi:iron(III) transport system permease protein|nr:iron ABC transporter permease [Candidatus Binatia bacterium]